MRTMKPALAALALLAAGCVSTAAPPVPVKVPATALAGTPCDPPMLIPPGIVASVRARFEDGRTTPPPPITAEDGAAYQKMQAAQRTTDWANLCYFRADNARIAALPADPSRVVFMGDSITQSWLLAHPDFRRISATGALAKERIVVPGGEDLELVPHVHGTDGFYAAVLERIGK